jgi:hypothetical protein
MWRNSNGMYHVACGMYGYHEHHNWRNNNVTVLALVAYRQHVASANVWHVAACGM